MGGKRIVQTKAPLKTKQLQTNLINCVEPVKGQGEIAAGDANARLKHGQGESEGEGRDEPSRQTWMAPCRTAKPPK